MDEDETATEETKQETYDDTAQPDYLENNDDLDPENENINEK